MGNTVLRLSISKFLNTDGCYLNNFLVLNIEGYCDTYFIVCMKIQW